MKTVIVDKIASVTLACALGPELRLSNDIPAEEGVVIVGEVLNNKSSYNTLELSSGRMAKVVKGDIVVGALGPRRALFGYSGHVPSSAACVTAVSRSTPSRPPACRCAVTFSPSRTPARAAR